MVAQKKAVKLLLVLLGAYCVSAYPTIWASMAKDCSAVPEAAYGPHKAPVKDDKTLVTLKKNGEPVKKICPGVVHKFKAVFPEQRQYILTTTQGSLAGADAACPNRAFSQAPKPEFEADLTVPCDAKGEVTLSLLSVGARSGDRTYQSVSNTLAVKDVKNCPASPCNSAAANKPAAAGAAAPDGALKMESALQVPAGTGLPTYDPAQMAELEKQIMALDPELVKSGSVNVQELLTKLGLQQQAMQAAQGLVGVTAPAPENAAAAAPDAPKVFQIGDIFGPLKHLLPGQQAAAGAAGGKEGNALNPLKFLQSVANLMPAQEGAAGAAGAEGQQQNPMKMLQNVAALVAAGSKDGKDGKEAPIMNLLQTVGKAIQSSDNNATASKDGLPILNLMQQLGGMVAGGKDKEGKPIKGMDPSAMLDVVKALGGLMPGESGGAPNMQNLMSFVNAVGKVMPGAGEMAADAPKDLPTAGIQVLKSLAAMMPKEGAGGATGPNWPAMLQFVKSSGALINLMRPAAQAAAPAAAAVAPSKNA